MKKLVPLFGFVHFVVALALASCGGLASTSNGGSSGKGGSSGDASGDSGGSGSGGGSGSSGGAGSGGSSGAGGIKGSGGHGGNAGSKGSGGGSGSRPDSGQAQCVLSLSTTECRAPNPPPCWLCPLESYPNCQNTFGPCPKRVASGWTCFACDAGTGSEFTCNGTTRDLMPNPYGPSLTCAK